MRGGGWWWSSTRLRGCWRHKILGMLASFGRVSDFFDHHASAPVSTLAMRLTQLMVDSLRHFDGCREKMMCVLAQN